MNHLNTALAKLADLNSKAGGRYGREIQEIITAIRKAKDEMPAPETGGNVVPLFENHA